MNLNVSSPLSGQQSQRTFIIIIDQYDDSRRTDGGNIFTFLRYLAFRTKRTIFLTFDLSDVSFAHLLAMNTPAYILNFLMVFTYHFFLIYTKYEYIRINQLFSLSEKSFFITFTNPTFHWLYL